MIRLLIESFPALRPATTHNARPLFVGGSRAATDRKNSRSAADIGKANAPFKTVRQPSHDGPANDDWHRFGLFIAATISRCSVMVRRRLFQRRHAALASRRLPSVLALEI